MNGGRDKMRWKLTKSGVFSAKSLYREMTFGGVRDSRMMEFWKAPIPLNIKIFMWLILKGRIQAAQQLKKMKWPGNQQCKLCGEVESVDHLFFACTPARFLWCCLRDILGWSYVPRTRNELIEKLKDPGIKSNLFYICIFSAVCWVIWLVRNDFVFNNKCLSGITLMAHKVVMLLQQWSPLVAQKFSGEVEHFKDSLRAQIKELEEGRPG